MGCRKDLNISVVLLQHIFQKGNDLEIIELLRKEPSHIRSIAQELNMIPSTVMRALKSLEKENVVDFNKKGRNSEYFLKNTLEASNYLFMAELYKLSKLIKKPILRRIVKEIKSLTNNELIVVFGSYAKNLEAKTSDLDIYIETSDKSILKSIDLISEKISLKSGKFDKESFLGKEIMKNHVILQNIERFYNLIK